MKTIGQYAEQALSLNSQREMESLFKKALEEVLEECIKVARNRGETECEHGHPADGGYEAASAIKRLKSKIL